MKLFDTHVHLLDERFDADRDAVIADLINHDVVKVVEACCDREDIDKIVALTAKYENIYGSVGIHPHAASTWDKDVAAQVEKALQTNEKIVAVGEIGLDYHYDFSPRETQKIAFAEQIELAAANRTPIIIHDREAHGDCMDILRAHKQGLCGVMHCFSGSYEIAKECIALGLHVAFGGALTFKNAVNQREIAGKLPLDRLVIETDCPYMTPEPFRGKRNDPRLIKNTLSVLAAVQQKTDEQVAEATYQNAIWLFSAGGEKQA